MKLPPCVWFPLLLALSVPAGLRAQSQTATTPSAQVSPPAAALAPNSTNTQIARDHVPAATSPARESAGSTLPAAVISNVTVKQVSEHVSVHVEGHGRFDTLPFRVKSPDRLVLDFAGTRLGMQTKTIPFDLPPVRAVRVAQHSPDVVRVVVDLDSPASYQITRDGPALVVSFELQANALRSAGSFTDPPSPSGNPPANAHSSASTPVKNEVNHAAPVLSGETKQPPAPYPSGNTPSISKNPPTVGSPASPAAAAHVLTPLGPVKAPAAPSAVVPAQAGQNRNMTTVPKPTRKPDQVITNDPIALLAVRRAEPVTAAPTAEAAQEDPAAAIADLTKQIRDKQERIILLMWLFVADEKAFLVNPWNQQVDEAVKKRRQYEQDELLWETAELAKLKERLEELKGSE